MSHLRVLICRVEDAEERELTELASIDLPPTPRIGRCSTTLLDELEAGTLQVGMGLLRRLLALQWEEVDARAAARYLQAAEPGAVWADGGAPVTVLSRFGTLTLRRRVCVQRQTQAHVMPGNAFLPSHAGLIITRGIEEWACLLPQELPFASVARLLGWQAQEAALLSATTVRALVRAHGRGLREVEAGRIAGTFSRPLPPGRPLHLVPHERPRMRAGWPPALTAAVEQALAREQARPPEGVGWADWERVLAARREDAALPVEDLRRLGPRLLPGQVLLTLDEVLVPAQAGGRHELRTACIATAAGHRYISGVGEAFLNQVLALLLLGRERSLLVIADGARWIRAFFRECRACFPGATLLLDWQHLKQKCLDLGSRICRGRLARAQLVRRLYRRLWAGQVPDALRLLEAYRTQARNLDALEELIGYLRARAPWIPNYRQRRRNREYIGSGHVEKANDRIVARRQKGRGMQWSAQTSDTLAALRTLLLNGGWEGYWHKRVFLPLFAA